MICLSLTIIYERSEIKNNSQRIYYVHYYLLLFLHALPLHKFHTTLSVLLEAQYSRYLKVFKRSSRSTDTGASVAYVGNYRSSTNIKVFLPQ